MELHKKTLLGLKAAPPKLMFDESEDEDSFFNDDDGDLLQLPPQNSQPRMPLLDAPIEKKPDEPSNRIKSFDEILPRISQITNAFEDQSSIPSQYSGEIYFIPEHIVSDEYSQELNNFIESTDPDAEFHFPNEIEDTEIYQNIYAQIDIVKYTKNQKVDLTKYVNESLDSRILSLIDFILSKQDDHEISCFYCTQSILEFIKTFEFAPISSLIKDYSIQSIFHQLSINLVTLFPHHPLLESILHKFSSYDPNALETLALKPTDDDDESDIFDDDFFADLQAIQCQKPTIKLNDVLNDSVIVNPLDIAQPLTTQSVVMVTINEPPSTFTYQLPGGSSQMSPTFFSEWIKSFNIQNQQSFNAETQVYEVPINENVSGSVPKQETYLSATTPDASTFNVPIKIDSPQDVDKNLLIRLIQYINEPNIILSYLSYFPNSLDLDLFPYLFPLLQSVNTTAVAPLKKGCIYPKLIVHEFDACQTLSNCKQDRIESVLNDMAKKVPADSKRTEIKPLTDKRNFPTTETSCPENIVEIISLSDIEIVLNGRSPFTFERIFRDQILNPPFEREWRAEVLYNMYISQELPPYIAFRVAFALALNLSEIQPERTALAVDILFEAMYGLLNVLPKMTSSECVRSSFLLISEMLDHLDRYYYSALFLDAYFLGNTNYQTSSQISPICQHRGDMVRSVFHFNQTMSFFIQANRCDEALYVSQVIASIYNDFGLYDNSISLLTYLLRTTYKLSVGRGVKKVSIKKTKTMPPVRQFPGSNQIAFAPSPSGTNTLLSGISLATLFVKCKYFKLAKELLEALNQSSNSRLYLRLIEFVSLKRLVRKNKFTNFLNSLPPLTIRQKRSSAGSRLTSLSASTFDTVIAIIKMLMTGNLNRNLLGQSIFWSEVILNTQNKFNLKDIGTAFLIRGECFLKYRFTSNVTNGLLSVHVPLSQAMSNACEYRDNHIFENQTQITEEAIASLKTARICFEKVGCQHKMLMSSILYTALVLQHFIDELGYLNEEPLEINNPRLETKSKNALHQPVVTFDPYTISLSNLDEHIGVLCQSIEIMTSRLMNPLLIIFSEIVVSKFNLFQKKIDSSKKRFEYAYTNFKKLFSCGGYVLLQDLSLNFVRLIHLILQYMCQLLLLFDQEFINNHLIAFDWMNDCDSLFKKLNRVIQSENTEPIDPSIIVSFEALESMTNLLFPDFLSALKASHAEVDMNPSMNKETLQSLLIRIQANIKLFEVQKMTESQLHENNRALCKQIENLADSFRHDHQSLIPPEADFAYSARSPSISSQTIFVQLLFDGIYVYIPITGEKRFCPFKATANQDSSQNRSHAFSKSISIPQMTSEKDNEGDDFGDFNEIVQATSDASLLTKFDNQNSRAESAPAMLSPLEKLSAFEDDDDDDDDKNKFNDKSILLGEPYSDDDSQIKKKEKGKVNESTKSDKTKTDDDLEVNEEQKQKKLQKQLQDFICKYNTTFTISPKKMQDQAFTSSSSLIPSVIFEYISYLIIPDRSNKKFSSSNVSQRTKIKFVEKLREHIFGNIKINESIGAEEWIKKPDKQVFYNIKSSTNKGALETVHKAPKPIVFVTSNSLRFIPFEILFKDMLVLRCWNYSQLILPGKSSQQQQQSPTSISSSTSHPSHISNQDSNLLLGLNLDSHSDSNENSTQLNSSKSSKNTANSSVQNLLESDDKSKEQKSTSKSKKTDGLINNKNFLELAMSENEARVPTKHTPTKKKKIPLPKDDSKMPSTPKPSRTSSLSVLQSQSTPLSSVYQYGLSTIIIRKKGDFEISTTRSLDLIKSIIISCYGAYRAAPEYVYKNERDSIYMCPAFLSGKETSYYSQKYPFCSIYDNEIISDELNVSSTLFLLSYADLCENHDLMRNLSMNYPSSSFLFIPSQIFKEALKNMKLIFERQKKRKEFILGKKNDPNLKDHIRLAKVPFEFITTLQLTLSNSLNCPIPLISLP